jgi:hypothetical protein
VLARQHAAELHVVERPRDRPPLIVGLTRAGLVVGLEREVEEDAGVGQATLLALDRADDRLGLLGLAQEGLGLLGLVPEGRVAG